MKGALSVWWENARTWLSLRMPAAPAPAPAVPAKRPTGPLVWIIGAPQGDSCGQTRALIKALEELHEDITILVSTTQDVPADSNLSVAQVDEPTDRAGVTQVLDHWSPDAVLVFPGRLSSNVQGAISAYTAPIFAIVDDAETRLPRFLLRRFERVFATGNDVVAALRRAGCPEHRIQKVGTLDDGGAVLPYNAAEYGEMVKLLGGRPLWLAAQCAPAEDRIMVDAHSRAARYSHRLLLILVPDDPARAPDLAVDLRAKGWRVALRSADEEPDADTQIYIADLDGELGMWLRIAPVTFLGGSLAGTGNCLNPRTVAELGSVIVHGPSSAPHKTYLAQMDSGRAARVVRDGTGLSNVLNALSSPDKVAELAHNAWDIATQNADATLKVAQVVGAALPATGTQGGANAGT